MKRVFLIVLDSCGVGYEPDAAEFGDVGANTLHTCSQSPKFAMPNLISMGLGNLDGVDYLPKTDRPQAALAMECRAADLYTLFGAPGTCCCAGMEQKYRIFRKKK